MTAIVVGAGGIGQSIARHLRRAGHEVVLASRSGRGLEERASDVGDEVATEALDATDADALAGLARGATILVNAVNPPYTRWQECWPPMAHAFLHAAQASGAPLLTVGNLYGYGRVQAPMSEATPMAPVGVKGSVRATMWEEALAAHHAGLARVVEVRASDYFGPGAGAGISYLNQYAIGPTLRGRRARFVMGDLDAPHSWTYVDDFGPLAVALAAADPDGEDWGRPWHVPTSEPRSLREAVTDVAELAGVRAPSPRVYPTWVRHALGSVVPIVRELDETAHQFAGPFVLDSDAAQQRFGLEPTAWRTALTSTVDWLRTSG